MTPEKDQSIMKVITDEAEYWDTHSAVDFWDEFEPFDAIKKLTEQKEKTQ